MRACLQRSLGQSGILLGGGIPHHRLYLKQTAAAAAALRWSSTVTSKDAERASLAYPGRPEGREEIAAFIRRYQGEAGGIKPGERKPNEPRTVLCGRIVSPLRELSSNLKFFHIESENAKIQVMADRNVFEKDFASSLAKLRRGDIVSVEGFPGRTKKGELSIVATQAELLTPCVKDLPLGRGDGKNAVTDQAFLNKHREVMFIVQGSETRDVFAKRARMISALRRALDSNGFLEVETPVLWPSSGGAFAKPFQTTSRGLTLRISPELSLKRLVVGGFDRVYELGKVFRDEGLSPKHNPEFTSIELYQAYANARDLEVMTKELLCTCFDAVNPNTSPRKTAAGIDFDCEYPRISVADKLEALGTFRFDDPESVTPERILPLLKGKARSALSESDLKSVPRLLDKLVGQEVESILDPSKPTFLVDHPVALSPLAKERPDRKGVVERFELFAGGFELCNAYSELNDPKEQRARFSEQMKFKQSSGDEELQVPDEPFCEALEYGLPPTAGWGMGVDRLVMVLTNQHSIRDVVLFPFTN